MVSLDRIDLIIVKSSTQTFSNIVKNGQKRKALNRPFHEREFSSISLCSSTTPRNELLSNDVDQFRRACSRVESTRECNFRAERFLNSAETRIRQRRSVFPSTI